MFICSVKAGTLKLGSILFLSAVLIFGAVLFAAPNFAEEALTAGQVKYDFSNVKTEEDRRRFLTQFGWSVKDTAPEEASFTIPEEFDRVMLGYNELQREIGLDLTRYKKKLVTRYTYEVEGYPGYAQKVYLNLIVYRGRVIGGDVSSADPAGFAHSLEMPTSD